MQSGVVEELDAKQQRLLDLVLEKIRYYYDELYETRDCYRYPLTLSRLAKLCNRNGSEIGLALRILANSIPEDAKNRVPPVTYERIGASSNPSHRPYKVFLRL